MRLPRSVRERFRREGRRGGVARARRLPAEARRTIAARAALRRWIRRRFGSPRFADLGLPGGALIDTGLDDLAAGAPTAAALAVSMAWPRLAREGVPLPAERFPDADHALYRLLEREHGDMAHARYNAVRRQVVSFADACGLFRRNDGSNAR